MTKQQFYHALQARLYDIPPTELAGYVEYYIEIIDDRIDEGMSEEEAVRAAGDINEIARTIRSQYQTDRFRNQSVSGRVYTPDPSGNGYRQAEGGVQGLYGRLKDKWRNKKPMEEWQVIVLVIVCVLCLPVLMSLGGVLLGLMGAGVGVIIGVFAILFALFASVTGFFGGGIVLVVQGIVKCFEGMADAGVFWTGAGLFLMGISVLLCFAAIALTKLCIRGIKKLISVLIKKKDKGEQQYEKDR